MNIKPALVALLSVVFVSMIMLSCGGPIGGYQVSATLNGVRVEYPQSRVYIEKVNVFNRYDGSIGYSLIDQDSPKFSHYLFTLVAGEWGADPVFIITWLADSKEISEIAGRNFAAYSIKIFPYTEEYKDVAEMRKYVANFNDETCYIVITITKLDLENKWINGIFNGVYVEQVGDTWWRMKLRDGRFGAGYAVSFAGLTTDALPDKEEEQ